MSNTQIIIMFAIFGSWNMILNYYIIKHVILIDILDLDIQEMRNRGTMSSTDEYPTGILGKIYQHIDNGGVIDDEMFIDLIIDFQHLGVIEKLMQISIAYPHMKKETRRSTRAKILKAILDHKIIASNDAVQNMMETFEAEDEGTYD